ncbi:PAS domain S-box protein, partial [Methanoregula sp.]|uniref:PAS domain S-box protein n=1 Tax=Methanoregula sp. TaxID=2052170 RepID=UPI000CC89EEB
QRSEQRYREIFNTVNDTIWIHDIGTFGFVFVNETIEETFGYTPVEALGLSVADISSNVPPFTEEEAVAYLKRAAAGEPQVFEWHCRHKDGHLFWSEVSLRRRTIAGRDYILAIERDITDRKRAEEARRESEERYRLLVENIPFGITLIGADHRIIMSNAAQGRMFHTDPKLWPGRYCYREFEKRDAVCTHCPGTRAMATGICCDVETEGVRDDGTRFKARVSAIPLSDPEGRITGFMEMVEDITDRKKAEDALRESEEKYRMLVEVNQDIIYSLSLDGTVLYMSPQTEEQLGYQPDEMEGRPFTEFVHPDDAPVLIDHMRGHSGPGEAVFSDRFRVRRKDGT